MPYTPRMFCSMPPPRFPCRDCTDRYVGCHSECEKYISARQNRTEVRKTVIKAYMDERIVEDYEIKQRIKSSKGVKKVSGWKSN